MNEPEILIEEISPNGNVQAVVEQTKLCCYFYLYGQESSGFGVKSRWVRNLRVAPEQLDVASMRNGE